MGKLKEELPKIVQEALKDEDENTRFLANILLILVCKNSKEGVIKKTLDNTIDNLIDHPLGTKIDNLEEFSLVLRSSETEIRANDYNHNRAKRQGKIKSF